LVLPRNEEVIYDQTARVRSCQTSSFYPSAPIVACEQHSTPPLIRFSNTSERQVSCQLEGRASDQL
jgi:hypothetical protein